MSIHKEAPGTEPLQQRTLGSTGLRVTNIGFGFAALGNMPGTFDYTVAEQDAVTTICQAFSSDVNFFDTAASYGDGESERRIGLALKQLGGLPKHTVLSTKADRDLGTGDFSGDQMKRSVERSLQLLGLDRIQLLFLHDPEHASFEHITSSGGALETLVDLHRQGVIEHLGVAGGPIPLMTRYVETGVFSVAITHNRYTLLNRSAEPFIQRANALGVAVINAAPFGGGILARGPEAYPRYAYKDADTDTMARAHAIAALCRRYDIPIAAAALQLSVRDPRIVSTIVGISRPQRIDRTLALMTVPIPEQFWVDVDKYGDRQDDPEGRHAGA